MISGKTVIKIVLYYIIITLTAQSLTMEVIGGSTYAFPSLGEAPNLLNILQYIWGMLQLFIGFFTFNVTGFPPILSLVFFWLPALYIILYFVSVLRATN